jgi:hypothetical protein
MEGAIVLVIVIEHFCYVKTVFTNDGYFTRTSCLTPFSLNLAASQ